MNRLPFIRVLLALPFAPELLARFQPTKQAIPERMTIYRGVAGTNTKVRVDYVTYSTATCATNGNFVVNLTTG